MDTARGRLSAVRVAAGAAGLVLALGIAGLAGCGQTIHQSYAESEYQQGHLDAAAADIQTALADDPDNLELKHLAAQIFTQRGVTYYQKNEMLAAAKDFHRAVDYYPTYAPAYDYLGLIAFQQHNWQDAIKYGDQGAGLEGKPDPGYVTQARQQLLKVESGGIQPYVGHGYRPSAANRGANH